MLKRFIKDEQGLETVEWVIMAGVIVISVVILVKAVLLPSIETGLTNIGTEITTATEQPAVDPG